MRGSPVHHRGLLTRGMDIDGNGIACVAVDTWRLDHSQCSPEATDNPLVLNDSVGGGGVRLTAPYSLGFYTKWIDALMTPMLACRADACGPPSPFARRFKWELARAPPARSIFFRCDLTPYVIRN